MRPASKTDFDTAPAAGPVRRVLVVDDSRLQRRILAGSLKKWGFETIEAESGREAIELCVRDRPDLILSDWMMPEMNGLEFCRAFRSLPSDGYGYFILLTSKSEKNEIAQGLDAGADDFLTKPVNPGELKARITAGVRILEMQRELSKKNQVVTETLDHLQRVYQRIDQDLLQAKKIQESLVPEFERRFGKSTVSLLLKPCGHIGGDLVGMFDASEHQIAFYSVDVSGHGITSAMMTAWLGGHLSSRFFDQNLGLVAGPGGGFRLREPTEVAEMLNTRLIAEGGIEEYFTMAYATADLRTGRVTMVQAGHPHPLILRADGSCEFVGEGGVPIGLIPGAGFSQFEIELERGDKLLLHSDGFSECRLTNGEMLETEGLVRLIGQERDSLTGQEFLDDLFWKLMQVMCDETGLQDDVSATLFEFN